MFVKLKRLCEAICHHRPCDRAQTQLPSCSWLFFTDRRIRAVCAQRPPRDKVRHCLPRRPLGTVCASEDVVLITLRESARPDLLPALSECLLSMLVRTRIVSCTSSAGQRLALPFRCVHHVGRTGMSAGEVAGVTDCNGSFHPIVLDLAFTAVRWHYFRRAAASSCSGERGVPIESRGRGSLRRRPDCASCSKIV